MFPFLSPIKSLIALVNKESLNPVSGDKTPAVWKRLPTCNSHQLCCATHMCLHVCMLSDCWHHNEAKANSSSFDSFEFSLKVIHVFSLCLHSLKPLEVRTQK